MPEVTKDEVKLWVVLNHEVLPMRKISMSWVWHIRVKLMDRRGDYLEFYGISLENCYKHATAVIRGDDWLYQEYLNVAF